MGHIANRVLQVLKSWALSRGRVTHYLMVENKLSAELHPFCIDGPLGLETLSYTPAVVKLGWITEGEQEVFEINHPDVHCPKLASVSAVLRETRQTCLLRLTAAAMLV